MRGGLCGFGNCGEDLVGSLDGRGRRIGMALGKMIVKIPFPVIEQL